MKLNNRGFAISTIMYSLLLLALILILATLSILNSRKMNLEKIKSTTLNEIKDNLNISKQFKFYSIGNEVTYKGINYSVIKKSTNHDEYVTVITQLPLLYNDVSLYNSNIVNNNSYAYINFNSNNYGTSLVKNVIEQWIMNNENINLTDLKNDGYKYRIMTVDEYNGVVEERDFYHSMHNSNEIKINNMLYHNDYAYFALSNDNKVYVINDTELVESNINDKYAIRPVLNIYKDRLDDIDE